MIPAIPPNASAQNLLENSQPKGWEHLGGPMAWFYEVADSYRIHEEYGPVIDIDIYGKVGEMITHFSETGYFPRRAYLFAGNQGIGKTALVNLMAMTHLAEEHEAITIDKSFFAQEGAKEDVTLLNLDTGEPLVVNPVETKLFNFDVVKQSLNDTSTITTSNIEGYNAGSLNKSGIDQIAESISDPLHVMGGRRFIAISEFDNVGSRQVPSLKKALDPDGSVPKGLLFTADTNYFKKVENSLGDAGVKRFRVIKFGDWSIADLEQWLTEYIAAFGIEFDYDSIDASERINLDDNQTIERFIASKCEGAIRNANDIVQQLYTLSRPVQAADILDFIEDAVSSTSEDGVGRVISNWSRYVKGNMSTRDFVNQAVGQDASLSWFANYLSSWLLNHTRKEQIVKTAPALHRIHRECTYYIPDQSTVTLQWSACADAFSEIRDALQNSENRRRR